MVELDAKERKKTKYKAGHKLWIKNTSFKDAGSKSQPSAKRSAKHVGPLFVTKIVGKRSEIGTTAALQSSSGCTYITHTVRYIEQPVEVTNPIRHHAAPVPTVNGEEYVAQEIVAHYSRGRGYPFLIGMTGDGCNTLGVIYPYWVLE